MYSASLERLGINCKGKYAGKVRTNCPMCQSESGNNTDLSVNITEGWYKCHKAKCGWKGSVYDSKYEKPLVVMKSREFGSRARDILKHRGISEEAAKALKIGINSKGNIQFDYYKKGELVNFKAVWKTQEGKRGMVQHPGGEPVLYNVDSLVGKKKGLIVEGEWDVAAWSMAGLKDFGIVSVPHGAGEPGSDMKGKLKCLETCAELIDHVEEWYICTDDDDPGRWLEKCLIQRFGDYKCKVIRFGEYVGEHIKDANDVLQKGMKAGKPKIENINFMLARLEAAKNVEVVGIRTLEGEISDNLDRDFAEGRKPGKPTNFPPLNGHFSWLPNDITLVTGIPGHGKSTLSRFLMMLMSSHDDWKWGCYAPEDDPPEYFYGDLIEMFAQKPMNSQDMTKSEFQTAKRFVKDHFYAVAPPISDEIVLPTNDWINSKLRTMKLKYGINAYYKDPWNKIFHQYQGREDQYLQKELSREKFFAKSYDAGLYVAHPRTLNQQMVEDATIKVGPYDVSGGSMWYNMMDNIMSIYLMKDGDMGDRSKCGVKIWKIKKKKLVGNVGEVTLDFVKSRNTYEGILETGRRKSPLEESNERFANPDIFQDPNEGMSFNPDDIPF